MPTTTYEQRRGQLRTYFDSTAMETWARLTSDAPVGRIRETVRAGRDRMRAHLLGWMPADLRGARLLDAGCGTGALAVEAARRGADVVAVDLSPQLVALAGERTPADLAGRISFRAGDFLEDEHGSFDYVVCMDSLIHYRSEDIADALANFAARARSAVLFTFAPRTPALAVMHGLGRMFPRPSRAPAIEPVSETRLRTVIDAHPQLSLWRGARTERVASGFYTSQAMELERR